MTEQGIILKCINGTYTVFNNGKTTVCKASPKLRHECVRPLCGDVAVYIENPDNTGYITAINERKNSLIRPRIANIDTLVCVASTTQPETDLYTFDLLTAAAAAAAIEVAVVINKCDLKSGEMLAEIYEKCGFPVICTEATTGKGIDKLFSMLNGKVACFSGASGVGKSSIMHMLYPDLPVEIGKLSEHIMRGKNTTRATELYCVGGNTLIADSPGFGLLDAERFDLIDFEAITDGFPEFKPYLNKCRYTKCTHTKEQDCAILEAIGTTIPQTRHESYKKLFGVLKDKRKWD